MYEINTENMSDNSFRIYLVGRNGVIYVEYFPGAFHM